MVTPPTPRSRPTPAQSVVLVFAGLVFSLNLFNLTDFLRSLGGFVAGDHDVIDFINHQARSLIFSA
jgi:hypothetical protein